MHKALFLLCPTDCLETVINTKFASENYFYTSLANSFVSNTKTLDELNTLIVKHNITKIYFVLSRNNQIILDALGKQTFSNFSRLEPLYRSIYKYKGNSQTMWLAEKYQDSIISYFLNHKIKELEQKLSYFQSGTIKIDGKIYNKRENVFNNIYSDFICLKKYHLN
ncbi:hypothetical protein [Pontimicrobium sp. MEBiC01747]